MQVSTGVLEVAEGDGRESVRAPKIPADLNSRKCLRPSREYHQSRSGCQVVTPVRLFEIRFLLLFVD